MDEAEGRDAVKPLTKHSALVYFDHFNDDRSVYLADKADAVIRELEAERDAALAEVTALQFRVEQQRILAGFGDTDLLLAREQRDTACRVLRRIADMRLNQFHGAHSMALACVSEAQEFFGEEGEDQ